MELSLNLVSIIAFYGLIAYMIFKNRKKIEFHKIYLLYKTKVGIKLLDKISKWRFWKYWAYIGIPIGFIGMIAIFWLLLAKIPQILTSPSVERSVQLLLPGTSTGSIGPFMFMPFWIFIICISVIIAVHEGAHGVIARVHNLKIKSTGLGIFAIIPLAFVEPDEEQLEKAPLITQLSVFAAGPFANICTAIVAMLISVFLLAPAATSFLDMTGLDVTDVATGFPADQAGIKAGDQILALNGVKTVNSEEFINEIQKLSPGDEAQILLQDREVSITTVAKPDNPEIAYAGVSFTPHLEPKSDTFFNHYLSSILLFLVNLFIWLAMLNIGIALVNLLPLGPVDGGRMIKTVLGKSIKNQQKARTLWFIISIVALGALIFNIFGPIVF